jgi:acyl-CoA synthetase (AMP-forming)/AMP-acid ligase II
MSTFASELAPSATGGLEGGPVSVLIRERSAALADKTYVEHARADRRLSFRGLEQAVDRWAITLAQAGIDEGSTVGLVISDPVEFSVAFLGTIASGRWAAPLDPSSPVLGAGGLVAAGTRVQADVIVADRARPDGIDVRWVEIGAVVPHTGLSPSSPVMPDAGGAVLASSGTTGVPKVIPLRQGQLLHTAHSVAQHHQLTSDDRAFNSLPLFHINAEVVGLMTSLVAGSTLVLDDGFHRTQFWKLMDEHRITWINAVPAIISRLADPGIEETIPSRLRFIRSASAPLPVATLARFEANTGIPVVETYGMTEAASQITANPISGTRKPGSVGRPVGVELRIVAGGASMDEAVPDAGVNHVGHVEIRGPSVITAYGGGHHGDRIDADGWLQTGDLGHFDEDGYLYLDSRIDDVINRGGEKVFPREIEEMVLGDPAVAAAAVVAAPDPELGQVPVAFLVLHGVADETGREKAAETVSRIRDRLGSALVKSKRPVSFSVVQELPAGATGKVQRRALRESGTAVLYHLDCR